MVKPLIDAEKEEYYEFQIHLNTFMLYPDRTSDINPLGISLKIDQQKKIEQNS